MSKVSHATAKLRQLTVAFTLIIAACTGSPARAESAATTQPRSSEQLEQLVAPIALYPDSLLAQVLMASTYPLEVVQAARWVRENSNVTGKALEDAMQTQQWDPSVKALTSVPQTLQMMNDKLDWTQQLGDAFLAQQQDVLDAVQRLRGRADAAGHLQTTEQQKVTRTPRSSSDGQATTSGQAGALPPLIYSIETANPEVYYVPIYDPGAVYGAWPYADYPPYSWYPPGYVASNVFSFAAGAFVGAAVWGNIDWRRRRTDINVANFNRFNRTNITDNNWVHNPAHRHGAPYRDSNVAARFADQNRAAARENFRGKAEAGQRDLAKRGAQGDLAKRAGQSDLGKRGGQGELGKGGGQSDLGKRGQSDAKGKTAGQKTKAKQTAAKQQGQAKNAQRSQQQPRNTQKSQQQARNTQKSKQAHNVKRSQPQARNVQRARQAPATHQRARAQQHARPGGGGGRGGGMGGGRGGGRGRR